MSENFFAENNNFWGFNGVLGRRMYIFNYCLVMMVSSMLFVTPVVYLFIFKPEVIAAGLYTDYDFVMLPGWLMTVSLCAAFLECVLILPSVVRRVRDITADDDSRVIMISSILISIAFLANAPVFSALPIFKWVSVCILVSLIFIPGKITGEKPRSGLIKFNWGAFWGTWIWGIFNKAWKTLYMIPLLLTAAWFPFMVMCGIKGNEWAYKKNNKKSLEEFHKTQLVQSVTFFFAAPLVSFALIFILFLSAAMASGSYIKAHPEAAAKLDAWTDKYMEVSIKAYFSKIELSDDENKFYTAPRVWIGLSDKSKRRAFDAAVSYIKHLEEKSKPEQISGAENGSAKSDEKTEDEKFSSLREDAVIARKTKIISTFNNEVLASYDFDRDELDKIIKKLDEKGGFKALLDYQNKAYKFNRTPSVP